MEERDILNNRISTTVRTSDFSKLIQYLTFNSIKLTLKVLDTTSLRMATNFSFKLFCSPTFRSPRKAKGAFLKASPRYINLGNEEVAIYNFGKSDKKILLVHGWEGRAFDFYEFIEPLLLEGYEVTVFDGPAHGSSTGKMTNALDFAEVINYLNAQAMGFEGIIAHSFGSFASALAINNYENIKPKFFVPISGPNKINDIINEYFSLIDLPKNTQISFIKKFQSYFDVDLKDITMEKIVSDIIKVTETNILLVHDLDDTISNVRNSIAIHNANPETNILKTQTLGHNKVLRSKYVIQNILDFIKKM
jgi:esterase/lipase